MIAIITGATHGIGLAICKKLIAEGMQVIACSRNVNELEHLKKNLGDNLHIKVCDMSKADDIAEFCNFIFDFKSQISLLVNNAGVYIPGNIIDGNPALLNNMLQVNFWGVYTLTTTLLPLLKQQKSGHIFNISSIAGISPYPNSSMYCISKYALQGFSECLRQELIPFKIKVTTINPGAVWSRSWEGSGVDVSRIMKADDIAKIVWNTYSLSDTACVEDIVIRPTLGDL